MFAFQNLRPANNALLLLRKSSLFVRQASSGISLHKGVPNILLLATLQADKSNNKTITGTRQILYVMITTEQRLRQITLDIQAHRTDLERSYLRLFYICLLPISRNNMDKLPYKQNSYTLRFLPHMKALIVGSTKDVP